MRGSCSAPTCSCMWIAALVWTYRDMSGADARPVHADHLRCSSWWSSTCPGCCCTSCFGRKPHADRDVRPPARSRGAAARDPGAGDVPALPPQDRGGFRRVSVLPIDAADVVRVLRPGDGIDLGVVRVLRRRARCADRSVYRCGGRRRPIARASGAPETGEHGHVHPTGSERPAGAGRSDRGRDAVGAYSSIRAAGTNSGVAPARRAKPARSSTCLTSSA